MNATKNSGKILGVLFAVSIAIGVTGTFNRGLSGLLFETEDVLKTIIERASQMKIAMALDIVGSAVSVFISIYLYKFVKSLQKIAAVTYILLGFVSFFLVVWSNWVHWELINIANSEPSMSIVVRISDLYDLYYFYHFLILLTYSIVNYILFYFMWRTRWVPVWLTSWGVLASLLVTYGSISNLMDVSPPFVVFMQNGIFMIIFTFWLIVAGFKIKANKMTVEC